MANTSKIDKFIDGDLAEQEYKRSAYLHSRKIALIKISLLLLAAILGVSLLFLPTLKKDINEIAIDLIIPNGDIEKMSAENTTLYVTDAKGRVNNFTAETIKETAAGSKIYDIIKPKVSFPLANGEWINAGSPNGIYNQAQETLQLPRKVELFYSKGFNIDTRNFFYDFKTSSGFSKQPVVGYGFLGHLNSEGMEIHADSHTIVFTGKTTIIIDENSLKKGSH